jgi:ubiquinone/menaquinone biosynthesis C-methylase UbiE/DNA-binding transcriptional ArsR family regulator
MVDLIAMLRAAGDPARLRVLLLLHQAELTVSEVTEILGQSQPLVSRHLKLLSDAGLIQRFKEGSWVFYRAADSGPAADLSATIAAIAAAESHEADLKRLASVRAVRAAAAAAYFSAAAAEWERIRALHAPEQLVEAAILRRISAGPAESLLDAGTGTGRMLELLAPHVKRAVGIDVSSSMLAIARDRIERADIRHAQVRLGDIHRLPFPDGDALQSFDVVLFHQVLHYLDDPSAAVAEAARVLRPGGRILIIDFASHDLEFLRKDFAHRRLGFADREVHGWFHAVKLRPQGSDSIAAREATLTVKIWCARAPTAARKEAA